MTTIHAPTTSRPFQRTAPINSAGNDLLTDSGVRISTPLYIDLPNSLRKELFNGVRTACTAPSDARTATASVSGISVEESSNRAPDVESYLGMNIDTLRAVLFSRGGLPIDLVLRLQAVSGLVFVTEKEINAALKKRGTIIKTYISDFTFN